MAFFCFLELGGVADNRLSSWTESLSGAEPSSSSSVPGFGLFFDAAGFAFAFSVVCDIFVGAALTLGAAVFLGAALGAAFALVF